MLRLILVCFLQWKPWRPRANTSCFRPQGHESEHQNELLIIVRVWFSLGVLIHAGMYFQQLPDYTVRIGGRGREARWG